MVDKLKIGAFLFIDGDNRFARCHQHPSGSARRDLASGGIGFQQHAGVTDITFARSIQFAFLRQLDVEGTAISAFGTARQFVDHFRINPALPTPTPAPDPRCCRFRATFATEKFARGCRYRFYRDADESGITERTHGSNTPGCRADLLNVHRCSAQIDQSTISTAVSVFAAYCTLNH